MIKLIYFTLTHIAVWVLQEARTAAGLQETEFLRFLLLKNVENAIEACHGVSTTPYQTALTKVAACDF